MGKRYWWESVGLVQRSSAILVGICRFSVEAYMSCCRPLH